MPSSGEFEFLIHELCCRGGDPYGALGAAPALERGSPSRTAFQLLDHRPVVLVRGGTIDHRALRRTRLTRDDLTEVLRARGIADLHDAELVIFEPNGDVSVIGRGELSGDLVAALPVESGHRSGKSSS